MSCCPEGSWPALEEQGTECNGKVEDLGGVMAYVVAPATPNGCAVVSFQDIFDYRSARAKGVADNFAELGFLVVHVDFTEDNYYKGELDMDRLGEWVKGYPFSTVIKPKLKDVVIPFIEKKGISKIGCIGFCWGSYLAFQASADPELSKTIGAAALFHPSLGLNAFFGGDEECNDVAEKVTVPQLFVAAGNDPDFVKEGGSIMKILQVS